MNPDPAALILFLRYPRPGRAKTRLGSVLGFEKAAEVYRLCCELLFSEAEKLSPEIGRYVFFDDVQDQEAILSWTGRRYFCRPQGEGDLGRRMASAFEWTFRKRVRRKTILVGGDIPDLSATILADAFTGLDHADIIIGPSFDGGYYLLGMCRMYPELFKEIPWGSNQVLNRTRSVIRELGLSDGLLPTLRDIDSEEDLRQWARDWDGKRAHPLYDFVCFNLPTDPRSSIP